MVLNYKKFGFVQKETTNELKEFSRPLFRDMIAYIEVYGQTHTLYYLVSDSVEKYMVANRYEIESQEELDFLILKGRIGSFIKDDN